MERVITYHDPHVLFTVCCQVLSMERVMAYYHDDDDDCFYVALFSTLEQTHCTHM